jgi:hypothetical protein
VVTQWFIDNGESETVMEHAPRLQKFGDKTERQYWGRLSRLVPHYETFWQLFVLPLRAPGSIWFGPDIDAASETVAIHSYSTFAALGRAYEQVFANRDNYRHIDEVYAAIQRSAEIGVKLIDSFAALNPRAGISANALRAPELRTFIEDRLSRYRNLIHDAILPMPKQEKHRKMPKPDQIDEYKRWTRVMYHYKDQDFVFVSVQARDDFNATCARLQAAWKSMCLNYEAVMAQPLPRIFDATEVVLPEGNLQGGPPASGDMYLGSDGLLSQAAGQFRILENLPPNPLKKQGS